MARADLRALFDEIPDPRVQRTRRHRLTDILVLVLLATVTGRKGWDEMEEFAREWEAEFRTVLALPGGIPSADTLRRVMAAVDPAALSRALLAWTSALCESFAGKQIAIDGKTVRGTLEAATGESGLHLVNAWVCEHQMVLGQYATAREVERAHRHSEAARAARPARRHGDDRRDRLPARHRQADRYARG